MTPSASNAILPTARDKLNAGLIHRSVLDFGAKCDVQYVFTAGNYSITAGGTTVTLNPVTFTGSISGPLLTVTATSNNSPVQIGEALSGTGITAGTTVVGFGTGNGGTGTYLVTPSQTAASTTVTGQVNFIWPLPAGTTSYTAKLPGHATGGAILTTTLTPTDATHAILGAPSVPGTNGQFTLDLLPLGTATASYAPGDTITMAGGTLLGTGGAATVGTVVTTYTVSASIGTAGTGGTDGTWTVYGTTGNGIRGVFRLTISGGAATAIAITEGGRYTSNPTGTPSVGLIPETVATSQTNITLPTGLSVNLLMGVDTIKPSTPGLYAFPMPATFTQASTSGGGVGATFTVTGAFVVQGFVYGTDDSPAINEAVNPSLWSALHGGAQVGGATIEFPNRPCGIASTITRSDQNVIVAGLAPFDIAASQGVNPRGSVLQWLGANGGTLWLDSSTMPGARNGSISSLAFECGIPSLLSPNWSMPSAAIGIQVQGVYDSDYGHLSFDSCASHDVFSTTASGSGNSQGNYYHDIDMLHPHMADGDGIYLSGGAGQTADSDYNVMERLYGTYQSAPLVRFVSLDNNELHKVHFFKRGSQQGVYGIDLTGTVYGSTEPNQANTVLLSAISSTSITRGKEASASPATNILVNGFDKTNSVPQMVARAGTGYGKLSWADYDGSTNLAQPAEVFSGSVTGTTSTSAVMAGIAYTFTPQRTGNVRLKVCTQLGNTTSGQATVVRLYFGPGAAPANGAALPAGAVAALPPEGYTASANNSSAPVCLTANELGLIPGSQYWMDVTQNVGASGTTQLNQIQSSVTEY